MQLVFGIILDLILGTTALWIVGRFSPDSPNIIRCFIGIVVAEAVNLLLAALGLPSLLYWIPLYIVLIKVARFNAIYALVGTVAVGVIKGLVVGAIIYLFIK